MTARALLVVAALPALAWAARAQDARPPPPMAEQREKALSAEDAEVVKQLALLEQVELLRNLELFEGKRQDAQQARQQGDGGSEPPQREP